MADLIRYEDRWTYVTLRVPKDLWQPYERSFPYWPHAVGSLRDVVLGHMARKVYEGVDG